MDADVKSPLDKPLHQLTEDDISQLTREDCRRYLKQKGMRRPSWNKSQAIQQVISLKTLLEPPPDSDEVPPRRKLYIPRPDIPHRVPKDANAETQSQASSHQSIPCRKKDSDKPHVPCASSDDCLIDAAENDSVVPRATGTTNRQIEQMTIFYCGKVNVYDDVPVDKALAVMQLAASPLCLPQEAPFDANSAVPPLQCHLQSTSVGVAPRCPAMILPTGQAVKAIENSRMQREESNVFHEDNLAIEGTADRKASIQRYREKRKDRFKSKRRLGMPSSTSMDIYINHQIGNHTLNEHSSRNDACSPPQIRPPNTPSPCGSSQNNMTRSVKFPAGVNDKDIME